MAARRIDNKQYREAAFTLFVIGVALFMSLFSFAVAEDARAHSLGSAAIVNAQHALNSPQRTSVADMPRLLLIEERSDSVETQHVILWCTAILAAVFVVAGFIMRDRYALGEDF